MKFLLALTTLVTLTAAQVSQFDCVMARDRLTRRCPIGKSYYYGAQLRKGQAVKALRYYYQKNDGDAWVQLDDSSIPTDLGPTWVRYSDLRQCSGGNFQPLASCPAGTTP